MDTNCQLSLAHVKYGVFLGPHSLEREGRVHFCSFGQSTKGFVVIRRRALRGRWRSFEDVCYLIFFSNCGIIFVGG